MHPRTFLYHAELGARLFEADEPLPTEADGWFARPQREVDEPPTSQHPLATANIPMPSGFDGIDDFMSHAIKTINDKLDAVEMDKEKRQLVWNFVKMKHGVELDRRLSLINLVKAAKKFD